MLNAGCGDDAAVQLGGTDQGLRFAGAQAQAHEILPWSHPHPLHQQDGIEIEQSPPPSFTFGRNYVVAWRWGWGREDLDPWGPGEMLDIEPRDNVVVVLGPGHRGRVAPFATHGMRVRTGQSEETQRDTSLDPFDAGAVPDAMGAELFPYSFVVHGLSHHSGKRALIPRSFSWFTPLLFTSTLTNHDLHCGFLLAPLTKSTWTKTKSTTTTTQGFPDDDEESGQV